MYSQHFELQNKLTYLNNGTHSITPKVIQSAIYKYQAQYNSNPTLGLYEAPTILMRSLESLGQFFKTDSELIFLRPNITEVLNIILLGLQLNPGDEILMGSEEYGAIKNIAKVRRDRQGTLYREFRWNNALQTTSEIVAHIKASLLPRTKVLVLSHVLFGTGQTLPIHDIGKLCHETGVIFVVDGAHALGSIDVDFSSFEHIDFYGGNLHKWMMGPKGTAFGWFHQKYVNNPKLKAHYGGWTSYDPVPARFQILKSSPQSELFLAACYDFAPFYAIHDVIEFWIKLGPQNIFVHLREVGSELKEKMKKVAGRFPPLYSEAYPGPLFCYDLPLSIQERSFEWMFELLNQHQIQITVAPRADKTCLRVTPHIYNSSQDIDRLVDVLATN